MAPKATSTLHHVHPVQNSKLTILAYDVDFIFHFISDALAEWNPMEEQYLSKRNAYSVDIDDPGVAMLGYGNLMLVYLYLVLLIPSFR